jgi:hypothetical protein
VRNVIYLAIVMQRLKVKYAYLALLCSSWRLAMSRVIIEFVDRP